MNQQENQLVVEFSQALLDEDLRCGQVYDEYRLKGIFIEDLEYIICQSISNNWRIHKLPPLLELSLYEDTIYPLKDG